MKEKSIPATITHISEKGVQVTWHRLQKPVHRHYTRHPTKFLNDLHTYEASKVTAWVENAYKGKLFCRKKWFWDDIKVPFLPEELYINQSCQVIETGNNKVKIIKLN